MACLGIGLNAYYFRIFKAPFPMKLQPQWISQRATAKRIATKSWDFALPLGGFFAPKTLITLMEEILHQLIGSLSHYLQGLIHARWCRISSINSIIYISHSTVSMYCKFTYFSPNRFYLWGSILEKTDWTRWWARWVWLGADLALLGALGWVGRRVWPCWARWLGWAWCWACWARWLGWAWRWAWGLAVLGALGWVGRGVGRGRCKSSLSKYTSILSNCTKYTFKVQKYTLEVQKYACKLHKVYF